MFDMFWIALELGNPKMGLNVILSLLVKKLSAFKNDKVAKSGKSPPLPLVTCRCATFFLFSFTESFLVDCSFCWFDLATEPFLNSL